MSQTLYDPDLDSWLLSAFRALKDYVFNGLDDSVGTSQGDQVYDVVFGYPTPNNPLFQGELKKTVIHFEIDDITDVTLGFGTGVVRENITGTEPDGPFQTTEEEAQCKLINWDVGIWSSYKSGGSTARMVAYQVLNALFSGPTGIQNTREVTDGIEVIRFDGGRFTPDTINDIPVFRTIDMELVTRVYVRRVLGPYTGVDTIIQDPDLTIDGIEIPD